MQRKPYWHTEVNSKESEDLSCEMAEAEVSTAQARTSNLRDECDGPNRFITLNLNRGLAGILLKFRKILSISPTYYLDLDGRIEVYREKNST